MKKKDETKRSFKDLQKLYIEKLHTEAEISSIGFIDYDDHDFLETLIKLKTEYEQTKNPIYAMDAFRHAFGKKYYPPLWTCSWLYNAFLKYKESEGTDNLQSLLGFTSRQKKGSLFNEIAVEQRNNEICFDILILKKVYNLYIEKAVDIVYEKQRLDKYSYSVSKLKPIDLPKETIRRYYDSNPLVKKYRNVDFYKVWFAGDEKVILEYFICIYLTAAIEAIKKSDSRITRDDIDKIIIPRGSSPVVIWEVYPDSMEMFRR